MLLPSLLTFLIGFLICYGSVFVTLRLATHFGDRFAGLDHPDDLRKRHIQSIPRVGGISIFAALIVLASITALFDGLPTIRELPALVIGSTGMFFVGIFDDFKPLPARVKLLGQILVAIIAWQMGLRLDLVTNPFSGESLELSPTISFLGTVFWLVAIPNVVNLADGMDGLAGGIGLFLCLTLGVVGLLSPFHQGLALIGFGIAGALVAFLFFNFPPAKIFLGDGGAYFLGFFIAAASLGSSQKSYIGASLTITLIALGLPILDTVISFGRRYLKGVPIMRGDSEHIHHRLLLTGMSSGKALFILYGIFLTLSVLALATVLNKAISIWMALGLLTLLAITVLRGLGYVKSWRSLPKDIKRILGARREVKYAGLVSQILEMEIDRQSTPELFWSIFEEELERLDFGITSEVEFDPIRPRVVMNYPFKGIQQWSLEDRSTAEVNTLTREAIAACFITGLCLGMKKFGHPGWSGLKQNGDSENQLPDDKSIT